MDGVEIPDAHITIEIDKTGSWASIRVPADVVADIKPDGITVDSQIVVDAKALEQEILANPGSGEGWMVRAVCERLGVACE